MDSINYNKGVNKSYRQIKKKLNQIIQITSCSDVLRLQEWLGVPSTLQFLIFSSGFFMKKISTFLNNTD